MVTPTLTDPKQFLTQMSALTKKLQTDTSGMSAENLQDFIKVATATGQYLTAGGNLPPAPKNKGYNPLSNPIAKSLLNQSIQNVIEVLSVQSSVQTYRQQKVSAPEGLQSLFSELHTLKSMRNEIQKNTFIKPTLIELPQQLTAFGYQNISYPEHFQPIIVHVVQRACEELQGLPSIPEAALFFCIEYLDNKISITQNPSLKADLVSLRTTFIRTGYSHLITGGILAFCEQDGSLEQYVQEYPLEKIDEQAKKLGSLLDKQFHDFFSVFCYFIEKNKNVSHSFHAITTTTFLEKRSFLPEKLSNLFAIEEEGFRQQPSLTKKLKHIPITTYFRTFNELISGTTPLSWCTAFLDMYENLLNIRKAQASTQRTQIHKRRCKAEPTTLKQDLNFIIPLVDRAIIPIASKNLPDECDPWFSSTNILRLEFLHGYTRSCFKKSLKTSVDRTFKIVCEKIFNSKNTLKIEQKKNAKTAIKNFLESMQQLRNSIAQETPIILHHMTDIDNYIKNPLIQPLNHNIILLEWLAEQVTVTRTISKYRTAMNVFRQDLVSNLRKILLKAEPHAAKQLVSNLISLVDSSFLSPDHEAITALTLYSEQFEWIQKDPREEHKVSLGFDESLVTQLQELLHSFPQETPPSPQSNPVEKGPCIPKQADVDSLTTLLQQTLVISTPPSPVLTQPIVEIHEPKDTAASVAQDILETKKAPHSKRPKKIVTTAKKTTCAASAPLLDTFSPIPAYWRQYCKTRRLIDLLRKAGYVYIGATGSHQRYELPGATGPNATIIIPVHSGSTEISTGVAKEILEKVLHFYVL